MPTLDILVPQRIHILAVSYANQPADQFFAGHWPDVAVAHPPEIAAQSGGGEPLCLNEPKVAANALPEGTKDLLCNGGPGLLIMAEATCRWRHRKAPRSI
jgi:hypothetical protein